MLLHPAQAEIARDKHRFRVVSCGRRFGKSTLAIEEMKGVALYQESKIAYIAPTYQQARDIIWTELKKELLPIATSINESRLEITVRNLLGTFSTIALRGWESIDTLRGQKFHFIVIDEVAMMRNFFEKWEEVIRPTLSDYKGAVMFLSTPKGFNHFYDLFCKEDKDPDYKSFHFTTYDNPFIPKDEIDKARLELTEDRFSQEYLADFRKTEGLVYKEFDRDKHIFTDMTLIYNEVERLGGIDFGFTNPTAVLEIVKDGDSNYWVVSEWYKTGKTNQEVIEYSRSLRVNVWYPDPAEPDRIEEMRRSGMNVREVNKDVEKGIDTVRTLLKNGKLKIHASCVNLINEIQTYSYKDKKPGSNEPEEPIKENDHALDALRYPLFMQHPVHAIKKVAQQYTPRGVARNVMNTQWLDKQN